jgi:hypothetical protein
VAALHLRHPGDFGPGSRVRKIKNLTPGAKPPRDTETQSRRRRRGVTFALRPAQKCRWLVPPNCQRMRRREECLPGFERRQRVPPTRSFLFVTPAISGRGPGSCLLCLCGGARFIASSSKGRAPTRGAPTTTFCFSPDLPFPACYMLISTCPACYPCLKISS